MAPSVSIALRQADRDPVVGPHGLHVDAVVLAQPRLDGHRPRRVDAAAERRQQRHPPVAELVAEALDHDRAVGRQDAGHLALLGEVGDEVACRQLVEGMVVAQAGDGRVGLHRLELAQEGADGAAQLDRPPDGVAVPERHLARLAGRRA